MEEKTLRAETLGAEEIHKIKPWRQSDVSGSNAGQPEALCGQFPT